MKIAFVTIGDARDIRRGSGTPYHLWQELGKQGYTVHLVGPLNIEIPFATRFINYLSKKIGKKYFSYRDPFAGRVLGRKAEQTLTQLDYDILLTNDYCIAGYTHTKKPIILYTDAIFPSRYADNVHPWLENLSGASVFFCQWTVLRGLQKAAKCIFASQYVMDEAKKYAAANKDNYRVIPYGANLEGPQSFSPKTIEAIHQKGYLDLLFIGKDWELKGGDIAVKTARVLNERGVPARLHVMGVDLSKNIRDKFMKFYGLLNKNNEADGKLIEELYATCDVLIVPSKAEGYGLAFVEAAAYGMPSVAYRSTGVITAVKHGKSGILLEMGSSETDFANIISSWIEDPAIYKKLSIGARSHYEEIGNWKKAVTRLSFLLEELTAKERIKLNEQN